MADPISQADYDNAAAVFSRSFRFIEWRFLIAADRDDGVPTPFGDENRDRRTATLEIDRRKWIYIFSTERQKKTSILPTFVDEIQIDQGGEMAATSHANRDKPIKERGKPESIGKSLCLPRRILGTPQVYRFFASRIRLEKEEINKLKGAVELLCPPVIFDPDQNNSIIDDKGQWLVPVIDPITVMLHLHAAYCAAADDVVNYTIAYNGNPNQKKVETRGKKHVLAMLLRSIIGDYTNTAGHNMANELKDSDGPINDFLKHYDGQHQWRVERRDRLAMFLVRLLQAPAVGVLGDAGRRAGPDEWIKFLVPWCRAVTRLSESPVGRKFLKAVDQTKQHFVHDVVLPEKELSGDAVQAVRKSGMTLLEAWKSFTESRILYFKPTDLAETAQKTLSRLREKTIKMVNTEFPKMTTKQYVNYRIGLEKARTYAAIEAKGLEPVKDHFSNKQKSPAILIESLNLAFAIMAYKEALAGDDPQKRELALIGLLGSSLDAASAVGSLIKKAEKVVATISFISGVIDVYLAHKEMDSAFKAGDKDAANGAFMVGAGSAVGASAVLLALMGIPGVGQIVAVIGLLIVAIGYLFKFSTSKTPIEHFFAHCTWGKLHGKEKGQPDWSPTDYMSWTGDGGYDPQFEALLNIICDFKFGSSTGLNDINLEMGWLPPGSKLILKYEEKWSTPTVKPVQADILKTDKGVNSNNPALFAKLDGKSSLKIGINRIHLTSPDPNQGPYTAKHQRTLNENFKESLAEAQLQITMEGIGTAQVPHAKSTHKGWRKGKIFEA